MGNGWTSGTSDEQEVIDSKAEATKHENVQKPDVEDDLSGSAVASSSVSEKSPRSPQLSDFGLERYMIAQVLPSPPLAVTGRQEEPKLVTPFSKQSLAKTPKYYTMGLESVRDKREEAAETEPVTSDNFFATPSLVTRPLEESVSAFFRFAISQSLNYYCNPLIEFFTPVSTSDPPSETNSSAGGLEVKDRAPLVSTSDMRFEGFADPPSPTISSYENLLRTPTPPEVTAIPDDIRQVIFLDVFFCWANVLVWT
ncbi:spindle and kinetochore-associated protein 3 [Camelus ferus]|nr:spindle and kinetochore-associated protein 3 [Camelus ferus]